MDWLTQNLNSLLIIGLVTYIVAHVVHRLEKRMERIEKRLEGDMVNIVNRMAMAILHPTEIEAESIKAHDAHDGNAR
jgi:hypothetical protein